MQPLTYSALEAIRVSRPVDRLDHIQRLAEGKLVFDLGALDETAVQLKRSSGDWLHARLCDSARSVIGIDNSALLSADGMETHANGRIIRADIFDLEPVIDEYGRPDVVVVGELIEHLPDALALLRSLKATRALRGVDLVLSTPNACSWHNVLIGLAARESTHRDHLQIYSYKTLRTLFDRAEVQLTGLTPYYARFQEMIAGTSGFQRGSVIAFQKAVNALEWSTPLLSAGWVATAKL